MKLLQDSAMISCLALAFAANAAAGEEYKAPDGSFRLIFPERPDTNVTSKQGLVLHTISSKGNSAELVSVMLIYIDHPKEQLRNLNADEYFQGAGRAVLETPNVKLLHANDINLGAFPGKEHYLEGFQGKFARIRHFLTGDRSYQLFVISENEKGLDSPDAEAFVSSFQVLRSQPIPVAERAEDSAAYRAGQLFGQLVIFAGVVVAVIIGVVSFLRSQRKSSNGPRSR